MRGPVGSPRPSRCSRWAARSYPGVVAAEESPRYRALLTDSLEEYRELLEQREADRDTPMPMPILRPPGFGVVLISQGHEVGGGDAWYEVGTYADIGQMSRRPTGRRR